MRLSTVFLVLSTSATGVQAANNQDRGQGGGGGGGGQAGRGRNIPQNCPVFTDQPVSPSQKTELKDGMRPCGHYTSVGCDYPVIPANVCHPGEGSGDLEFAPYIVQFDIGLHANVLEKVTDSLVGTEYGNCIGCAESDEYDLGANVVLNAGGETCLEIIVKGNSGVSGGCAGKCGSGCVRSTAGWALDCLKHDVCATYKAIVLNNWNYGDGFCYDPDCGDEAAQTLMECYDGGWGFDMPITCAPEAFDADRDVYGYWTVISNVFGGPCSNFEEWSSGQGIPNRKQIRNPYDFLTYLEDQGVNISAE